jgi:hypothetical protein
MVTGASWRNGLGAMAEAALGLVLEELPFSTSQGLELEEEEDDAVELVELARSR